MTSSVRKTILHNGLLLAALIASYLWSMSLSALTLQLISFTVIVFVLIQFLSRKVSFIKNNKMMINFLLLAFIVFVTLFSSGGLYSPFFFLLYFLLFGIALVFEPVSSLILTLFISLLLMTSPSQDMVREIIQIGSLFLIAPLSVYFGSAYLKLIQDEEKIDILKEEGKILDAEVKEQETKVKSWTKDEFKQRLIVIWESLDALSSDISISENAKGKIAAISKQLSELLKSAETMKEEIEK